jgi:hypothetical protein
MRFSPLILLPAAVLAAVYDTPTASVATITNTRTVMRVATVTSTGHSSVGIGASSYAGSLTSNATTVTTAKVSPTASPATLPSNGASQDSINVALVAIAGVASFFLL